MSILDTVRAGLPTRSRRIPVQVRAQMRVADRWADIVIQDVSARGLRAHAAGTPAPGSYVEIRRGADVTIVGRIVWRRGTSFSLRAQDPIDIGTLVAPPGSRPDDAKAASFDLPASQRRPDAADVYARSRRTAVRLQFLVLTAFGLGGAAMVARIAYRTLVTPLMEVANHL